MIWRTKKTSQTRSLGTLVGRETFPANARRWARTRKKKKRCAKSKVKLKKQAFDKERFQSTGVCGWEGEGKPTNSCSEAGSELINEWSAVLPREKKTLGD